MKTLALALFAVALSLSSMDCTPAAWAKADVIFNDVLSGVEHQETIEQIELQVAADAGFSGVVNTVVVTLVVDALDTLINLGVIPPQYVPSAVAMETQEADKLVKMGGHMPHALLSIHRGAF
jgi:hypothetical protein